MTRLSTPHLLGTHLRSGMGADALIAALVAVTVFVAAAVPSALAALTTAQLRHVAAALPEVRRDLTATGPLGPQFTGDADASDRLGRIGESVDNFPGWAGEPLAGILGDGEWLATTRLEDSGTLEFVPGVLRLSLSLTLDPEWAERVRLVAGSAPGEWSGETHGTDGEADPIPVAISAGLARQQRLEVGDLLRYSVAPLEVAAIYEAIDPVDSYWQHAPLLLEPITAPPPDSMVTASVYLDPASARALHGLLEQANATAWWPVRIDRISAANASSLEQAFRQTELLGRYVIAGTELRFSSGLPEELEAASARMGFVAALLALVAAGPLGVVFAVDGQAAQSVVARRRAALALAGARGASARQLRGAMAIEGLLVGVPAALLGYLATRLLFPAEFSVTGIVLATVFGLAPAALLAVLTPRPHGRGERTDLAVRSRSGVRWVVELAVIGLTALAVVLIFRRDFAGSAEAVGVDPLLASVPLLLAISCCVITLRAYPALLILVQRVSRTRRGAVALLGAARAVRSPALGFATGFALLVGVSISVFSTGIATSIGAALAAGLAEAERNPSDEATRFVELTGQPVMTGLRVMLLLGAAIAIVLGTLAVALGSIAASEPRNRLLGVARVLGFSGRQLGALVGWELAPLAIVAILVGTAVGVAELQLLLAALDLRPFLGTADAVVPILDPLWVAGIVVVFAGAVLAAGFATAAIARRLSPASSIKMGAE